MLGWLLSKQTNKQQKTANAGENVEKLEPFAQCWWECKIVQPLWKTGWSFLKKLKIELPHGPAIPLLSLYWKDLKSGSWRILALSCALQHFSHKPTCENKVNVYQKMNRLKKSVVYICTIILLGLKNIGNSIILDNMDEPWGN